MIKHPKSDLMVTDLEIPIHDFELTGHLVVPKKASSVVIFSHGSGSSRFSPRNRYVSEKLNEMNIATILTDMLSPEEDEVYENRFDTNLLGGRLCEITVKLEQMPRLKGFKFGIFGASTGAASALCAASKMPELIDALVLRGGRPDLVTDCIAKVKAPTLMIVGGLDPSVVELNRKAAQIMTCKNEMVVVEGAGHLFEEPSKLDQVAELSGNWFKKYLQKES